MKNLLLTLLVALLPLKALAAIELERIAEGVWVHTSLGTLSNGQQFPSNGLIVKSANGVALVDTAWGVESTRQLLAAIKENIGLPVGYAVVTHSHDDRTAGIDVLKSQGIAVYGHPLTVQLTIEKGAPVPNHTLPGLAEAGQATTGQP